MSQFRETAPNQSVDLDVVWGAEAIAAKIKRTPSATYHMLENGMLPGAKKVAGRWCFAPSVFFAHMTDTQSNAA